MSSQRIARDPWLDNAKMALVTLVVVGHAWALLPGGGVVGHLYDFLYVWHLPAFVFVTGYLSRKFEYTSDRLWSLVRTLALPYVMFECLLALFRVWVGGEQLENLFADPHWPLWYLTALIFWRLATPVFRSMPAPLAVGVAIAVSAVSGVVTGTVSDVLDLTRVAGLLPFFVLGLHMTSSGLERLRAPTVRWLAAGTFVVFWFLTAYLDALASTEWLYYRTPYDDLGVTDARGMVTRMVLLAVAVLGSLAFLALVPRTNGWFARMGAMTLVVYLCHGFVVLGLEYAGYADWAAAHPLLAPLATLVGAVLLALALAAPSVARRLKVLVDPFGQAEQQVKEAVQLNVVAQSPGNLPAMETGQTQLAER
jgi:fucose 4-O-acetylase-like acetyltransferase